MTEAWFAKLPAGKLTALETELREQLIKTAATARRLLPKSDAIALQEWVDRRIPGDVTLTTSPEGWVTLHASVQPSAGTPAAPGGAVDASKKTPLKPVAKAGPAGATGASAAAAETFFSRLPTDSFTSNEENLRTALKDVLVERGPLPVTQAMQMPEVSAAARATLIRAVNLADWVERRIGSEVQVVENEKGIKVLQLARLDKDERRDAFFAELPTDKFSAEEEALRGALIDFLATWKSKDLATLSHAGGDKAVQSAKSAFFGQAAQGGAVTLREWIERRIGQELELQQDAKGQWVIHVTAVARRVVAARFQELEWQRLRGSSAGGKEGKGVQTTAAGKSAAKGNSSQEKGKGAVKAAIKDEAPAAAARGPEREAIRNKFWSRLPQDRLEQKELKLREVLLDYLNSWQAKPGQKHPFFTDVDKVKNIQQAKVTLLPPEVSLKEWIESRVGGEILTFKDKQNAQFSLMLREDEGQVDIEEGEPDNTIQDEAVAREEKKEAFFASLPPDGFSPEEEALREALFAFLDAATANRVPATLSGAGSDPQIRETRAAVVPKGCGASLKEWIDRRVGGEIETYEVSGNKEIGIARRTETEKPDKEACKEAFFEGLPGDGFTPEEERMRDALLSYLGGFTGVEVPTLSTAGADPEVREARAGLIPKGSHVSLREWIERRIGMEVETMQTDGAGQVYVGFTGELEAKVKAMPKNPSKRSLQAQEKGGKGLSGAKGSGKDGKRASIGAEPPAKRLRR